MLRVYLTGELQLEHGAHLLREAALPGRQGRLTIAYLVCERHRAVPQAELAGLLWPDQAPAAWPVALSAIISKLRSRLAGIGLGPKTLVSAFNCYQLRLPESAWVDLEAAAAAVHLAEGALLTGDPGAAYGPGLIAMTITRRAFLPGEEAAWAEGRRRELAELRIRALDCFSQALAANGEFELAIRHGRDAVRLDPFREPGYRTLMRLLSAHGERAEALRVYEQCRATLSAELGVDPSPETRELHRQLLQ